MVGLSRVARLYVLGVALSGVALVLYASRHATTWAAVAVLALLVVGAEALSTTLAKGLAVTISVAMPIIIASVLLLGPWGAALPALSAAIMFANLQLSMGGVAGRDAPPLIRERPHRRGSSGVLLTHCRRPHQAGRRVADGAHARRGADSAAGCVCVLVSCGVRP